MSLETRVQGVKTKLEDALEKEIQKIPEYLQSIEKPDKKLDYLIKLMPYILPKINNISVEKDSWFN